MLKICQNNNCWGFYVDKHNQREVCNKCYQEAEKSNEIYLQQIEDEANFRKELEQISLGKNLSEIAYWMLNMRVRDMSEFEMACFRILKKYRLLVLTEDSNGDKIVSKDVYYSFCEI